MDASDSNEDEPGDGNDEASKEEDSDARRDNSNVEETT